MILHEGKYTNAKVMIDNIDETCVNQLIELINHPAFTNPVAIMPDTHLGVGSVIGFTMELTDKVIPNTIGVDISCGMLMLTFSNKFSISREGVDRLIRVSVPFDTEVRDKPIYDMAKFFPWDKAFTLSTRFCHGFNKKFNTRMRPTFYNYGWFEEKCNQIGMNINRAINSIGTLGGGNHFIEIGRSENTKALCVTIHTGSRQFGLKIANYWQNTPVRERQEENKIKFAEGLTKIKASLRGVEISEAIKKLRADLNMGNRIPKDLDYIEGEDMQGYLADMIFCQVYAQENRRVIAAEVVKALKATWFYTNIETVHNYINFEDFIIRKGAVSAHKDELFILPLNNEDGILVCKGKGNEEWNYSAPHGAGRIKSRTQARAEFSSEVAKKRMEDKGIYTSVIPTDEVKEAYKDPKIIEEAIQPTAEVIDRVAPILNLKGGDKNA